MKLETQLSAIHLRAAHDCPNAAIRDTLIECSRLNSENLDLLSNACKAVGMRAIKLRLFMQRSQIPHQETLQEAPVGFLLLLAMYHKLAAYSISRTYPQLLEAVPQVKELGSQQLAVSSSLSSALANAKRIRSLLHDAVDLQTRIAEHSTLPRQELRCRDTVTTAGL